MRMRALSLLLLAALAITACDHTVTSTTDAGTPSIKVAGAWTYSVAVSFGNASCQGKGTGSLNQNGDVFTGAIFGTQVCSSDAGPGEEQFMYLNFTNGEIAGLSVLFRSSGCVYYGVASSSDNSLVNDLAGTASCFILLPDGTETVTMTGPWHLSR
jgi:hypothetical protein